MSVAPSTISKWVSQLKQERKGIPNQVGIQLNGKRIEYHAAFLTSPTLGN
jgi:hypothetical protein